MLKFLKVVKMKIYFLKSGQMVKKFVIKQLLKCEKLFYNL